MKQCKRCNKKLNYYEQRFKQEHALREKAVYCKGCFNVLKLSEKGKLTR